MTSTSVSKTTLSVGEAMSRSKEPRDGRPRGFFARALTYLSFRKSAVLPRLTVEDPPAGSDPWATNRATFAKVGDDMLAHFKRTGQPLSIIVLVHGDLAGLTRAVGVEGVVQLQADFTAKLQRLAAPRGASIRTDVATFAVLLPGIGRDKAQAALQDALGAACSGEARVGAEQIDFVPDFLVQTVRREATSIKEVYRAMRQDIHRAQQQALSRTRSSRTEPDSRKPKSEPVMEDDARFASEVRHELTIPMPLGPR